MSWVLVIPFDVMKTIMQAESDKEKYGNMRKCLETNINVSGVCSVSQILDSQCSDKSKSKFKI